jgi:RimJ/RimL family protein N-acetyltransferase
VRRHVAEVQAVDLPRYRGVGYAYEAAAGVLQYAASACGLRRVVAITVRENERSGRLLEKLGLRFERMVAYPGEDEEVRLFVCELGDLGETQTES